MFCCLWKFCVSLAWPRQFPSGLMWMSNHDERRNSLLWVYCWHSLLFLSRCLFYIADISPEWKVRLWCCVVQACLAVCIGPVITWPINVLLISSLGNLIVPLSSNFLEFIVCCFCHSGFCSVKLMPVTSFFLILRTHLDIFCFQTAFWVRLASLPTRLILPFIFCVMSNSSGSAGLCATSRLPALFPIATSTFPTERATSGAKGSNVKSNQFFVHSK